MVVGVEGCTYYGGNKGKEENKNEVVCAVMCCDLTSVGVDTVRMCRKVDDI